jgi:hypothetical protein
MCYFKSIFNEVTDDLIYIIHVKLIQPDYFVSCVSLKIVAAGTTNNQEKSQCWPAAKLWIMATKHKSVFLMKYSLPLVSPCFTQQHIAELVVHLKFLKESGQVVRHFEATFAAICSATPLKIACGL